MVLEYAARLADGVLARLVAEVPAVLMVGPRAVGKTTTARRVAAHVVRLDRPAEAAAFRADPDAALRGLPEPVLLDEWQEVPDVLGAVKRAVDDRPTPGRFILAGSVRAHVDTDAWPGTGRLVRVRLLPLCERELAGRGDGASMVDVLFDGPTDLPSRVGASSELPDLRDYLHQALRGGFPEPALRLVSDDVRAAWTTSYVDHLVTRDVASVGETRDPVRLTRYLNVLASNTAGIVDDKTLYDTAGIDRKTAAAYERLLSELFVLETAPAWWSNRLKRLTKSGKRYLIDGGLAAGVLGLGVDAVMADGDVLGRFLDTFVAAQVRAELLTPDRGRLHHLRQEQGRREVDLIVERAGRLVGIEVKASAAPDAADARHLAWLRDEVGERFRAGVVLHTGPGTFELGDRLWALPIAALWS
ncbi:MAG TPA: DUF4143 domain-containing protein [Nitriliruptorales bacterium]